MTTLPTSSRLTLISSTAPSGASPASPLTPPPTPMPAWAPISSDSSRRSVMASAIGLASSKPAGLGARGRLRHLARRRPRARPRSAASSRAAARRRLRARSRPLPGTASRPPGSSLPTSPATPFRGHRLMATGQPYAGSGHAGKSAVDAAQRPGQIASGSAGSIHTVTVRPGL